MNCFILINLDFLENQNKYFFNHFKFYQMKSKINQFRRGVVANLSDPEMGNQKGGTYSAMINMTCITTCGFSNCNSGTSGSDSTCQYDSICQVSTYPFCT